MSYIQGNYTQAQLQALQQIYDSVPAAMNNQNIQNADEMALQNLMNQFPPESPQAQAMSNLCNLMGELHAPANVEQMLEQGLAIQMYPQLPNTLNQSQLGQLQSLQKLLNDPTPENLELAQGIMQEMQMEAQLIKPQTPQITALIAQLNDASQNISEYQSNPNVPFSGGYIQNAQQDITFLLPKAQGGKAASIG